LKGPALEVQFAAVSFGGYMKQFLIGFLVLITINLTSCANKKISEIQKSTATVGLVKMEGKSDTNVQGTILLTQDNDNQVTLQIDLTGFPPNSTHAFHIHANGDCSDVGAASAGPHFNPSGTRHGGPDNEIRHAGDMGNLVADEKGEVHTQKINTLITLHENLPNSAIGKSIIIHQDVDDFQTQPTGNAGARVSCGVIRKK
jgi:Cu-Zn family superoxide dismutase